MLKNFSRTLRFTLSLLRRYCNLRHASDEMGSGSCLWKPANKKEIEKSFDNLRKV